MSQPPNIILIVADDLGCGDLSCYGQTMFATPHIQTLADSGMVFDAAYANSCVCAPSRWSLLMGRHMGQAPTAANQTIVLQPGDVTIAKNLAEVGYQTKCVGKWANGALGTYGHPLRQGFNSFFGYLDQIHAHDSYPVHLINNYGYYWLRSNRYEEASYAPGIIEQKIFEAARDGSAPFFLYAALTLPHANNELDTLQVPVNWHSGKDWPEAEQRYATMIGLIDNVIRRVIKALDDTGKRNDTLIIFTSDNGAHSNGGHDAAFFDSNQGRRGGKAELWEGGIRVPFVASWPGRIPAGARCGQPFQLSDLLATFGDVAGYAAGGWSLWPWLAGARTDVEARELYWAFENPDGVLVEAARAGDWKGVRFDGGSIELHDLAVDVAEVVDVAAQEPVAVEWIRQIMEEART